MKIHKYVKETCGKKSFFFIHTAQTVGRDQIKQEEVKEKHVYCFLQGFFYDEDEMEA